MGRDAVHHAHMRIRIAQAAARLIAEDGGLDLGLAKRKAARQLGAPDSHSLPSNDEVEQALADYQGLFVSDHAGHLRALREQALEVMQVLAEFNPVLVGGVATGRASEQANIEIDLFLDSTKDFEMFLLNHDIEFRSEELGGHTAYQLYSDPADVSLRVLPENAMHAVRQGRGEPVRRMTRAQLAQALNEDHASANQRAASSA
jgi:hypothetical protein